MKNATVNDLRTIMRLGAEVDTTELALHKSYACDSVKQVGEDDDRTVEFVISTGDVDRDNDTIDPDGWRLDNFNRNPVVFFGHKSNTPPIAKAVATWVEGGKLRSRAQFTTEAENPFGAQIFRMVKGGFLKSSSVGFKSIKAKLSDRDSDGFFPGIDFVEQELFEWSVVPIPANPAALVQSGYDLAPFKSWCEQALDEGGFLRVGLSRLDVERAWAQMGAKAVAIVGQTGMDLPSPELQPEPMDDTDDAGTAPAPVPAQAQAQKNDEPQPEPEPEPTPEPEPKADDADVNADDESDETFELEASDIEDAFNSLVGAQLLGHV